MFTKLLVPLDRSRLAEQAIEQAAVIARASRAEIDLVLVHQPFPFAKLGDTPWNPDVWKEEQRYVESIARELSSSVGVTHAVLKGETIEMICRRIEDVQADLVVMTSHGRTGFSRAWLGSVADAVLRYSTVPVLMLRPAEGDARWAPPRLFERILVPVDDSSLSATVLPAVAALAKCGSAHVTMLRVAEPPLMTARIPGIPYTYVPQPIDESTMTRLAEEARVQLSKVARQFYNDTGVEAETHVVVDSAIASTIVDFARANAIDLIAMSTHGRGLSRLLLGSVADKVLRGSGVPMLLFRPFDVQMNVQTIKTLAETPAFTPA
jgi:nucleotide-binding universal stress UspA family protein